MMRIARINADKKPDSYPRQSAKSASSAFHSSVNVNRPPPHIRYNHALARALAFAAKDMLEPNETTPPTAAARPSRRRFRLYWLEWAVLIAVITLYSRAARLAVMLPAALLLGLALADVYRVNQPFATNPHPRNTVARAVLTWLRREDLSLYYTNIGGTKIYWDWAPYAYELEMPMLNFRYNRRVRSMDAQYGPGSPFNAQPKYVLAAADHTPPEPATLLATFNGVNVWRRDDALPFAFAADPNGPITWQTVAGQAARLDGPNRVIVTAGVNTTGRRLVVLVSDYPGWQLWVDGQRAAVEPLNGYLGAALQPGAHIYEFSFRPPAAFVGMAISGPALMLCVGLLIAERRNARRARQGAKRPAPMTTSPPERPTL